MTPSRISLAVLAILGLFNLGRGALHAFLPDSGAGAIAHFDLSQGGQTIVFLLATTGAAQIGAGLVALTVAARYRTFAVPLLAIEAGKTALAMAIAFVSKPPPHEIPGRTGMIVTLSLLLLTLAREFGRRTRNASA